MSDSMKTHVRAASLNGVLTLTLDRTPVNALNREVVRQLNAELDGVYRDPTVRALVLTGTGAFFSFGFDVPSFMDDEPRDFTGFLEEFTALYSRLFTMGLPVIAALNGHTIAGGCMLALACDRRLMVTEDGLIALNEVTFGASLFAGSVEMLAHCVGPHAAELIIGSGAMLTATEARDLGLVDELATRDELPGRTQELAENQWFTITRPMRTGSISQGCTSGCPVGTRTC